MNQRSYSEIQAEIARLQAEGEAVRKKEIKDAKDQILKIMADYGLTKDDLGLRQDGVARRQTGTVAPKYQDPETGKTWSGRGRAPLWTKEKNLDDLAIKP